MSVQLLVASSGLGEDEGIGLLGGVIGG